MRIVYFAHSVLNRGGDRMVLAHLDHLAASGHEVVIRSNVVQTLFPVHPAIAVEKPALGAKAGTLLCALMEKQRADLVIATIVPTAVLLAVRNRGKVLHFAQDDNETAYSGFGPRLMRSLYFLAFSLFRLPTVTVSRALADTFQKRFSAHCRVVGNGVDRRLFFPSPSAELMEAKAGRKAVLLLSRPDPRKGFEIARRVVALLHETAPLSYEVWTVGDDPQPGDFPCAHRHFGMADESRLRSLMSSADVFLYPTRSEGFGLMVLEAFSCRCPVVTTEAVPFVRHKETALVSAVGDQENLAAQVREILSDRALAASIVERAYAFSAAHSLETSSREFEQAVLSAAEEGSSAR